MITAKIVTDPKSRAYGRLGFNTIMSLPSEFEVSSRVDREINQLVKYHVNNHKNIMPKEKRSYYHTKPNTILKLELLLKIKYGQRIEVEY